MDHDTGGLDNLGGVALSIDLAEASPFTKFHLVLDGHDWHAVFSAECCDELLVGWLGAVVGKDAQLGATFVEVLGAFADSANKACIQYIVWVQRPAVKVNANVSSEKPQLFGRFIRTLYPFTGSYAKTGITILE